MEYAQQIAPLGGFRNILVHEYLDIEWNIVYDNLQHLDDLARFAEYVRQWLRDR
jgi:uncharacterized protein YutE (UPF0331/DUF86 family)